jgi:hypothetical protein
MRGMVGKMRRSGGVVPSLLALVLLFRLMIPVGYMIGPNDLGGPGLVLCGAVAGVTAGHASHPSRDGHPAAPLPAKSDGHPCPYAAVSAPPVPPAAPAVLPPVLSPGSPPALREVDGRALPALAAPPPPATGPPLPV